MTRGTKTRAELHSTAVALAKQYQLVHHNAQLFVPVSWMTLVPDGTTPDPLETVWLPMTQDDLVRFGNHGGITFQNASEVTSFVFMLKQYAERPASVVTDELFVKTPDGLRVLNTSGELVMPDGLFRPNLLEPTLNTDQAAKDEILAAMEDWLDGMEQVESLLYHLATILAPGYSAVKIVLLLGEGRNGKSTLMKMVKALLGKANVSDVTRQQMSAKEPAIVGLNNKLANIVFDASSEYLKDSSTEKTLVAGETIGVRMLYENGNTEVWTNGLFIEGQNQEPKTRDKSKAMQKRIVRFWFPKEYPLNKQYERHMLSPQVLGAFLSLLIDHYVTEDRMAELLVPSTASNDLQIDQLWNNSKTFQWLHEVEMKAPGSAEKIRAMTQDDAAGVFHAWLMGGKDEYSAVDAHKMLKEAFVPARKSQRVGGIVKKVWYLNEFTPDAARMLERLSEGDDDGVPDDTPVVDD